jgi:hypothetical protein
MMAHFNKAEFMEYVQSKARLNSDGCWLAWSMKNGCPHLKYKGKNYMLRRAVAYAVGRMNLKARDKIVILNQEICDDNRCVNHEHFMVVDKGKLRRRINTGRKLPLDTVLKIQRAHQTRHKTLTREIVVEGRQSGMTPTQLAKKYGSNKKAWGRILRNETWKDYNNTFSALAR